VRQIGVQLFIHIDDVAARKTDMTTTLIPKLRSTAGKRSARAAPSAAATEVKRERMHLRLDTSARHKIELAAHYVNKTVSDFVLSQAVVAADKVIDTHGHSFILSEADWERFCAALDQAPKPNRKLNQAARRYARRGGEFAG
jgi:uncharacterized protein (DUF1778 family)